MSATSAVQPREAHKRDPQNLWIRRAATERGSRMSAEFSVPRDVDDIRFVDILELERQAGIVFAHRALAVPEDAVFLLSTISLVMPPTTGVRSNAGVVEVTSLDHDTTRATRKATMRFEIHVLDEPVGTGFATARFLTPSLYARVRAGSGAPRSRPGGDSPPRANDTPIAASIDPGDPTLIDHTTDHVPAMAIAAAIERTATADRRGATMRALTMRFHEYIEVHPTPTLLIGYGLDGALHGRIEQDGQTKADFSGFRG